VARFKVLNGVAHNVGHSFTSLMNYAVDDYSMGYILKFSRESGDTTLTIDFMTGSGNPESLLRELISVLPARYTKMFWDLITRSGSARELVRTASLTLTYDLKATRLNPANDVQLSPYVCDVVIEDVRGKSYSAHFSDWWYVEAGSVDLRTRAVKISALRFLKQLFARVTR
jgi:hypothetical protein